MANKDVQSGGVMLADNWKLFPVDDRNWELCQLRVTADTASARKSGTVGMMRWQRCGRFYSYNTVPNAIMYVADVLVKESCEQAITLVDALDTWREAVDAMTDAFLDAEGR